VTVYVACTDEFTDHAQVANGASELLIEVLGDAGKHARAAVGMAALPLGTCVEVAVTAELTA
jgi:enamine deaminase RidA (YjgF/YER057c/UK114 family)